MKLVKIRVQSSKHLSYHVVLPPGTRVSIIRTHLNLPEEYVFAPAATPHVTFEEDADVHSLVTDGAKLIAKAPVKINSDEAREDLKSLLVVDDDPPSEPIDTSEDAAYIRSWFKEEDKNAT